MAFTLGELQAMKPDHKALAKALEARLDKELSENFRPGKSEVRVFLSAPLHQDTLAELRKMYCVPHKDGGWASITFGSTPQEPNGWLDFSMKQPKIESWLP